MSAFTESLKRLAKKRPAIFRYEPAVNDGKSEAAIFLMRRDDKWQLKAIIGRRGTVRCDQDAMDHIGCAIGWEYQVTRLRADVVTKSEGVDLFFKAGTTWEAIIFPKNGTKTEYLYKMATLRGKKTKNEAAQAAIIAIEEEVQ